VEREPETEIQCPSEATAAVSRGRACRDDVSPDLSAVALAKAGRRALSSAEPMGNPGRQP